MRGTRVKKLGLSKTDKHERRRVKRWYRAATTALGRHVVHGSKTQSGR